MISAAHPRVTRAGFGKGAVVLFESPLLDEQNPLSSKTQTLGGCVRVRGRVRPVVSPTPSLLGFPSLYLSSKNLPKALLGFRVLPVWGRSIHWYRSWPPLLLLQIVSLFYFPIWVCFGFWVLLTSLICLGLDPTASLCCWFYWFFCKICTCRSGWDVFLRVLFGLWPLMFRVSFY